MRKIIALLVLVLLVSGCTGLPGFNIFGQKEEVKEMPEDVISVENINVLPAPPIIAGDQFSLSFNIVNYEEDDPVYDVSYRVLDAGLCGDPITGLKSRTFVDPFVPGQVEFVEWTFKTPISQDIAYIKTACPVRFKVSYSYFSESEIEVNVISSERYTQLQQAGEFTTFIPTLTVGRGPIKIYMELGAALPIRTGSILPVYITVQNKGSGLFDEVAQGELFLGIPGGFDVIESDCAAMGPSGYAGYYTNIDSIPLVGKKTYKIKCSLMVPGEDKVDIEQTYFLNAYFHSYVYEVLKEVSVNVNPLTA
ncbi:MAG: lipoprotein [Candidatus Aenigmatarchaeota archaeon]